MTWLSLLGTGASSSSGQMLPSSSLELEHGLRSTFILMEGRRLQRRQAGVQVRQGCLSTFLETFMVLGTAMYVVSFLHVADARQHYWLIEGKWLLGVAITLTVLMVLQTWRQACYLPDNVALRWSKTWCWLLVVWAVFISSDDDVCDKQGDSHIWTGVCGQTLLYIFGALQLVTWLIMFVFLLLLPCSVRSCRCGCTLKCLWRIRREEGDNRYSFLPIGSLCPRRRCFQYWGRLGEHGPEDYGIWRSDHHHGEIFSGYWKRGHPQAPFLSQTFGTRAISMGLRIGYYTARCENRLEELRCLGERVERIRYGWVDVECSVAGTFLGHLPRILPTSHTEKSSLPEVLTELEDVARKVERLQHPPTSFATTCEASTAPPIEVVVPPPPPRVRSISLGNPTWNSVERIAIVLVHGYNCSLATACLRLGQLLALGNFEARVLPIVFSWSTGSVFSYFPSRASLPTHAQDLPRLLAELEHCGYVVHIIAHSMGCELVGWAAPDIQSHLDTLQGRGYIRTITLINSTTSCSTFFEAVDDQPAQVSVLASICDRLTLYCDRDDWAIQVAEVFGWYKSVGRYAPEVMSDHTWRRRVAVPRDRVDVIDCTTMDANVHGIRHSYFDLNTSVVSDIQQLTSTACPAEQRNRLTRLAVDNSAVRVYTFLAPPVFVTNG
mmetsp:Transcript_65076/g.121262  ORF Transcript_65076/g.121262 Transcript_65076/m.121262 type:complete len:665 (+) Transcript_65076:70-2064(+)